MKQDRTMDLKWTYPEFPPRPVKRDVILSLMNYKGALYLINQTNETLSTVSSESFGIILDSALEKNPEFFYKDVKPNESVKVEEYDGYYDLDYILGFDLYIESKSLGKVKITPPMKKGGVIAQELVYADMSLKRCVYLEKLD